MLSIPRAIAAGNFLDLHLAHLAILAQPQVASCCHLQAHRACRGQSHFVFEKAFDRCVSCAWSTRSNIDSCKFRLYNSGLDIGL